MGREKKMRKVLSGQRDSLNNRVMILHIRHQSLFPGTTWYDIQFFNKAPSVYISLVSLWKLREVRHSLGNRMTRREQKMGNLRIIDKIQILLL